MIEIYLQKLQEYFNFKDITQDYRVMYILTQRTTPTISRYKSVYIDKWTYNAYATGHGIDLLPYIDNIVLSIYLKIFVR